MLYRITKRVANEARDNEKAVKEVTVFLKTREFEKISNVRIMQRPV